MFFPATKLGSSLLVDCPFPFLSAHTSSSFPLFSSGCLPTISFWRGVLRGPGLWGSRIGQKAVWKMSSD